MESALPALARRAAALAVHLYTALGAVLAFWIVLAATRGDARTALALEFVTMAIDGTDGWLARAAQVKAVLPWFDGRKLDDIVDYLTYVFAPIVLLWDLHFLPGGTFGLCVAALPLLASCYGFCRTDAKTPDHFFLGFPSYWNIVAFYCIIFRLPVAAATAIIIVCALLVFVPVRYVYPTRTVPLYRLTVPLTGLWMLLYLILVLQLPQPNPLLAVLSLLYIVYYVGLSFTLSLRPGH